MTDAEETAEQRAEQHPSKSAHIPATSTAVASSAAPIAIASSSSAPSPSHIPSPAAPSTPRAGSAAGSSGTGPARTRDHHHTLSLSPRSNPAFSDPDYYADREDTDDVFSNPDTAELEARSDATGSTSPDRTTSPILGSPDNRGRSGYARSFVDTQADQAAKPPQELSVTAALHHRPSRDSQITQSTITPALDDGGKGWRSSTVTPTASAIGTARSPSLSSSPSAHRESMRPRPASAHYSHPVLVHDANMMPLPAANDLPSDPSDASSVSMLFAHPPGPSLSSSSTSASQGSPALNSIRLALSASPTFSVSPGASRSVSTTTSPSHERAGFQWTSTGDSWAAQSPSAQYASRGQLAAAVHRKSGSRTTPTTRPSSPDRKKTIMAPLAIPTLPLVKVKLPAASSSKEKSHGHGDSGSIFSSSPSPVSAVTSSRSFGGGGVGLGLSSPHPSSLKNPRGSMDGNVPGFSPLGLREVDPQGEASLAASESSIFERDIEHRDARHVLSKSEAVDVAIPPVLDDAVEAIIEGGEQPLEIVSPLASASAIPHALSAIALSAQTPSSTTSSPGQMSGSPMMSSSSPTSAAGALLAGPTVSDGPPPGSIAAQIAERFGAPRSATGEESLTAMSQGAITGSAYLTERRPQGLHSQSSGASSTSGSANSRSPGPTSASVQQVLEGGSGLPGSPLAARAVYSKSSRDLSPAPHATAHKHTIGPHPGITASVSRATSLSGTAFPSLPLPNPFRSDLPSVARSVHQLPSTSVLGFMEAGSAIPAPMTMSLDGAIIPSSESAIREMSLDGMADVLAEIGSESDFSPSPILPRKVSVAATTSPSALAFQRRDTSTTITPADDGSLSIGRLPAHSDISGQQEDPTDTPGGFLGGTLSATSPSSPSLPEADTFAHPALSASPQTRRLSFFSYADIINDTPAELVDFEEVVSREMACSFVDDARPSTSGKASSSPRASFGGAGMAKPFCAPHDPATGAGVNKLIATIGSPSPLGK